MSIEQDIPKDILRDPQDVHQQEGRVVIDAVHGRFRRVDTIINSSDRMYIRCEDCNSEIAWNDVAIRNHFNNLHSSHHYCRYCRGKVFIYRKVIIVDGIETSEEFIYHKCDHNQQAEAVTETST